VTHAAANFSLCYSGMPGVVVQYMNSRPKLPNGMIHRKEPTYFFCNFIKNESILMPFSRFNKYQLMHMDPRDTPLAVNVSKSGKACGVKGNTGKHGAQAYNRSMGAFAPRGGQATEAAPGHEVRSDDHES